MRTISANSSVGRLLVVVLACLVFGSRAFVDFKKVRVKLVERPIQASAGNLELRVEGFPDASSLQPPIALIARIRNAESQDHTFRFLADGANVCDVSVSPGEHRVDCAIQNWPAPADHRLTVESSSTGWSLSYLEIATHHGNTSGAAYFVILPRHSQQYAHPSTAWVFLFGAVFLGLLFVPATPLPAAGRFLHQSARVVIGAGLIALTISPYASRFLVVGSTRTFVAWLLVWTAPNVWFAARWVVALPRATTTHELRLARSAIVTLVVMSIFGSLVQHRLRDDYSGNYSGFLLISRHVVEENLLLRSRDDVTKTLRLIDGGGYDGQYMYIVAFDPLLRAYGHDPVKYREVVDAVPYRFGRIGFPWLTRLAAAGRWAQYPFVMMSLILLSLGICSFVLAHLAQERGLSPALGAVMLIVPGFWGSVQNGLPEPVAASLFLSGYFWVTRDRWVPAAACFALSLLVRETGVLAVGTVIAARMCRRDWRTALLLGLGALLPVLIWRGYIAWVLFPDWGWEGFFYHPGDVGLPFQGLIDLWREIGRGTYYSGVAEMARAGIAYPLLLLAATAITVALVATAPSDVTIAALLYAIVADCLNYRMIWVHVGNGQRGTYELFVMLALTLLAIRTLKPMVRATLVGVWVFAAVYVFFLAVDAATIRETIMAF